MLQSIRPLYHRVSQSACFLQSRGYTDEDSAGQSNIFAVEVSPQSVLSHSMRFYQPLPQAFRFLADVKCILGFSDLMQHDIGISVHRVRRAQDHAFALAAKAVCCWQSEG